MQQGGHLAKACRNPEEVDRPKQKDGNAVSSYSECFIKISFTRKQQPRSCKPCNSGHWLLGSHTEPEGIIYELTHS